MSGARSVSSWCARLLVFTLGLTALGCATPVFIATAGISALAQGTSAYFDGELTAARRIGFAESWFAALDACNDLDLDVIRLVEEEGSGYVLARDDTGADISILVKRRTSVVTKFTIRIGVFGDRAMSEVVLEAIQARARASAENGETTPIGAPTAIADPVRPTPARSGSAP